MRAVVLNAGAKLLANGTGRGFGRIGGAHGIAPPGDGAFSFENHYHCFSRTHEFRQLAEEWPGAVNGVKTLRFRFGEPQGLDGHDLKLRRMNAAENFSGKRAAHSVWLDDCESAF